jgi:hypothetical protein
VAIAFVFQYALAFTIKQMAAIDIAYRAAFPAGG